METVIELMSPQPICVTFDTPLHACAVKMRRHHLRHLPMTNGDGRVIGVVRDLDVFRRGVLAGSSGELWMPFHDADIDLEAGDVAEQPRVVVRPEDDLAGTLRAKLSTSQDYAVVVDEDGHPMGMLTEHDALRMAQALDGPAAPWLSEDPEGISADEQVADAWERMIVQGRRHLLILDKGRLAGVISLRDLSVGMGAFGREAPVGQIWRGERVHTLRPGQTCGEAAAVMVAERVGCLPLTDEAGFPTAILTRTDLIRALVEHLDRNDGVL
ncbi:MAG: CBS domain-containing protein [Deltaproteobacteria bacterium]|nr:CBS domain-containing protein [Deltaproteobacteria bacterium]